MRPSTYTVTIYYQHQLPQTVLSNRNRVASMLRNARRDKCFVEKGLSSGGLASRFKIHDGSKEIVIHPNESALPSHIEVFHVSKSEGWATIAKDMNHYQIGDADFSYHKRDAVAWAKRLQLQYMDSGERRGCPPMPIHVFTKEGVKRVID